MRQLPLRARLLVLAVAIGGASALAFWIRDLPKWTWQEWLAGGALLLATVVAQRLLLPLPHGKETESFSMVDAVWVAALLLVEPSVFLVAAGAGVLIGQALFVRNPTKIVFNVGQDVLALSLAVVVFGLVDSSPEEPAAWLAAAAGMGTYYVLNASIVSLVIAAAEDKPFREVLLPPLLPDLLHWATNVALGILVAVAWIRVPEALPLLVVPLALAYFAYRGWVKTLRERDRMHQMARTADAISEQGDLEKRLAGEDGGDEVGSLAATLNRMLDRLEASFRRERRFISEASHELRTPVTICRGHLEVLGADPDPEELRETIDVVLDELNRVGRLIGDLTILARAEDPRFVRPAEVQIGRFLDELATKAVPLLNGRLHATPAPNGAVAQADAQRLTQALINLLHNAGVHTTSDTKVELRVAGEERFWRFEVEDTGGGLPPGREETLFRPFSRATTASPGSGLGLAIVRQIAEAHGGSAGAENRPGEGVTFWIRVPR